jgi:hypothetical protein
LATNLATSVILFTDSRATNFSARDLLLYLAFLMAVQIEATSVIRAALAKDSPEVFWFTNTFSAIGLHSGTLVKNSLISI